ncbi:MAG: flagellar biosynthesis anti-sigma factor FlgM [Rhodocyclaceae bacterium]|nr:flagellar biosynthesis anti-sigma factor FlgM [Rhodocyclaceae bacterium]
MKIENSVGSTPPLTGGSSRPRSTATAGARGTAAGEQVQISSQYQAMEAVVSNTPVVNTQRVAEIKQAIAEGRFQVNPEKIANGLIESVKDMLSRAQR